jgi:hypothetical protein
VRLRRIHPVQAGVSEKRLKNIRASVLKALELCGASRSRSDWLRPPSPAWAELLATVPSRHDTWKLSQLAQYCTALDIPPGSVRNEHIRGLLSALEQETFIDKPAAKVGAMVSVWNRLKKDLPGWPDTPLTFPRQKQPWTIHLDRFPKSFTDDVDKWLDRLAHPDPLSGEGPAKPLRPATIEYNRFSIQQIASAILHGASLPLEEARDLQWLVDIDRLKQGLRYVMGRFDGKPTEAIHKLAVCATSIAQHYVKVDADRLAALKGLSRRLKVEVNGLRAKNKERLEQLDDDDNLARLLHLPSRLRQVSRQPDLSAHRSALVIQAALCIEILLHAPMRSGNLSRLSLERHIRRARVKGKECLLLSIPGAEVKNGRDLSFELTGDALELFDLYVKEYRPVLLRAPSEYLFPAQDGGPKRPHTLSALIKETIHAHTGLVIHAHLFRSIAGKIHFMIHPGDFLTLGHAIGDSLPTTMKAYAQFEQKNAGRHYQASVAEARKRLNGGTSV